MERHKQAVSQISKDVRSFYERAKPFRIFHGGTNSTRQPQYSREAVVDTSGLDRVLKVDTKDHVAQVEPNVSMRKLVTETLKHGLIPSIVMELPAITVGGGFSGNSGESTSWKYGLFDCTINAIEIVLANGEVEHASRSQNPDLLYGAAGSFGTLGVITMLEVQLMEAAKYVELTYFPVSSVSQAIQTMQKLFVDDSALYIDGIMYSDTSGVIMSGQLLSELPPSSPHPQTFHNAHDPQFYLHAQNCMRKSGDSVIHRTVPLEDYLFRYDRGGFWVGKYAFEYFFVPYNRITRFLLNKFMHTEVMWHALHESNLANHYIIQDLSVPMDKLEDFMSYVSKELHIWPLWLCPIKVEASSRPLPVAVTNPGPDVDEPVMFVNVGVWGFGSYDPTRFVSLNRDLELKVKELGGAKALYGRAYYTEEEFWSVYDKASYDHLRRKWHAETLPTMYEKVTGGSLGRRAPPRSGLLGSIWHAFWSVRPMPGLKGVLKLVFKSDYLFAK